ncbi:MAG: ABC transporter ATP-binding protein [Clostridia bacterium]|nr:ABC transporter ATP-binding protein [Clostridia bacterium]
MLKIENLTKIYRGGKRAVNGLSIHVRPGDIYGFAGRNGAGKTTTLRCVAGIIGFEGGEIHVDGRSVKDDPIACKGSIAYIPDNPDLYEYLTGIQYLNFIADVFGVSAGERTAAFEKYGGLFELTENFGDLISSYSHGMKQKLAIIAALSHKPKLLLLDEPFVGLDPKAALTLKNVMRDFCAEGGAIFFSTHVLDVAEKLCNRAAIIRDGALVACGTMEELTRGGTLESLFMEVAAHAEAD